LAAEVVGQPLLQRYGVSAAGLARDLVRAIDDGEQVIVVAPSGQAKGDEAEGGAVGFAWFLLGGTFGRGGYLRLIALQPGQERRGLGAALLDEVERRVGALGRPLFLLVSHWNDGAQRFYAARGYREVGRLPAFVRADTDEIILHKAL
jgi:ribosomal protein S18 acetylase RimI-like enzyme